MWFENVIFNLALLIGIFKSSYDNVLRWMPQNLTDDQSTLVQVMAWCRQATSQYLNQCWPRSPTPYGVTRPQWVKDENSTGVRLWTLKCAESVRKYQGTFVLSFISSYRDGVGSWKSWSWSVYLMLWILCLPMAWRPKELGHQQPWCLPSSPRICLPQHQ